MGTQRVHRSKKSTYIRKKDTASSLFLERKIFVRKKNPRPRQKNYQIQVSPAPSLAEVSSPSPLGFASLVCVTVLTGRCLIFGLFL